MLREAPGAKSIAKLSHPTFVVCAGDNALAP
jgi:hypothetical protein